MKIGDVVRFQEGQFFNGAVQLGWVQEKPELAREVARAFVFHGPRYHGANAAEGAGIAGAYRLKDTAGLVRDLLGTLRAKAEGREANPYWLAVAGYGSGKSHLSVAIAALLSEPGGETTTQVLGQIRNADAEIGAEVERLLGELGKPVLVLPIDGSKGLHLGTALSRVVFAQLARAGVDADAVRALSPRFQTADQFVERNFALRTEAFGAALPGRDAAAIRAALGDQDEDVFDAVNAVYTESNGQSIPIEGQESAQELIETLSKTYCAEGGPFSHVLVLFDELGLYLEHAADHPERAGAHVLQEVFQGIQDNGNRAHFIGFIQYELNAYLKRFGSSDLRHLQRYVTRFDAATKWYLSTNLETLFAHMVRKDRAALDALWQQANPAQRCRQIWQRMSSVLPGFNRVSVWADPQRFAEVIYQGCWPLHPLAVWFLTRQRDLVQQRSALAFVKDVIERLRDQPALEGDGLRQVGAADLVLDYMLPELVAAEQESGGNLAETLRMLLAKHAANLDRCGQLVLAGIAVLDKAHVGRQPRETVDALLGEATALDGSTVAAALTALSALGAAEWNQDLLCYELLSDGASRAQFEQWMRAQRQALSADDVRALFVRRGLADCPIGDIRPDFDRAQDIRTQDWYFEARPAHIGSGETLVRQAFEEWRKATLPTDPKGKLIYLYLHEQDDAVEAERRIEACFNAELERGSLNKAPIWAVVVEDRHGRIAEHLARLAILDEKVSSAEQESFRRFIPDERERSRSALREAVEDALKEQRFLVAGFPTPPATRLKAAGGAIFGAVYPSTLPFPFDGFSTANGGGAQDAVAVAKALMAGNVNYSWIQAQPVRLRNRIIALLQESWQALKDNGDPVAPKAPALMALYQTVQQEHQDDPSRTLLESYRQVISPPYGLNASSAAILFGLLLGARAPQRAIEVAGQQFLPGQWIEQAFPTRRGRHWFDESALGSATLRFFDGDVEARWRALIEQWDAEERYDLRVQLAREAKQKKAVEPLPPSLAEDYARLNSDTGQAAARLAQVQHDIGRWQDEIQQAHLRMSVHHALKCGAKAVQQGQTMQDSAHWPPGLIQECESLAKLAKEVIAAEVEGWIPRQNCFSAPQVAEFRQRTEAEARWLATLGFSREGERLTAQAQRAIARVEELQRHTLTLAKCEDYPRQPRPTASTPVLALRDELRQGDELIAAVQAIQALSATEKTAHQQAVQGRQALLNVAIAERQAELGGLYDLKLEGEETVREAAATVERLRQIFAGRPDEAEINDLANQLQRILTDAQSLESGDVGVERLGEILDLQVSHRLDELRRWLEAEDIEPPPQWDLDAIYRFFVAERVETARRRSADWLRPRLAQELRIPALERAGCASLEQELVSAPAWLADADRRAATRLLEAVRGRLEALGEVERAARVATWQRPYLAVGDVSALDRATTETLLRNLDNPPCPLRLEEQAWRREASNRLTGHLDQIGIDDLVARFARLSQPMRQALFDRLSQLMAI